MTELNELITPELKEQVKSRALYYWYIIVIVVMLAASIFLWQRGESAKKELTQIKTQITLNQTILETEARLEAVKAREADYLKIQLSQDKLNKTLIELDKRQKELEKLKKESIANEVHKMDSKELSSAFSDAGFTNKVIQ